MEHTGADWQHVTSAHANSELLTRRHHPHASFQPFPGRKGGFKVQLVGSTDLVQALHPRSANTLDIVRWTGDGGQWFRLPRCFSRLSNSRHPFSESTMGTKSSFCNTDPVSLIMTIGFLGKIRPCSVKGAGNGALLLQVKTRRRRIKKQCRSLCSCWTSKCQKQVCPFFSGT